MIAAERIETLGFESLILWVERVDATYIRLSLSSNRRVFCLLDDIPVEQDRHRAGEPQNTLIGTDLDTELLTIGDWVHKATIAAFAHTQHNRAVIPWIATQATIWFEQSVAAMALSQLGRSKALADYRYALIVNNTKPPGYLFRGDGRRHNDAFIKALYSRQLYEYLSNNETIPNKHSCQHTPNQAIT